MLNAIKILVLQDQMFNGHLHKGSIVSKNSYGMNFYSAAAASRSKSVKLDFNCIKNLNQLR